MGGMPVLAAVKLSEVDLDQLHVLDDAERQLAAKFGSTVHRDRFLAGRMALRFHVADVAGVEPGSLHADYLCRSCGDEDRVHGAPRYRARAGGPWILASLSKSGDWCLMAAAANNQVRGVGVDLESSASANFDGFGAVAMTARERNQLQEVPAAQRPLFQTVLWTRKEAVLKALGSGLFVDPSLVDVAGPVPLLPERMSGPGRWVVEDVDPGPLGLADDCVAAMAVVLNV
ncbi:4'-phosphopantetheinyl transferase family protein [Pseudarthrobacter sp. NPDC058329]|uniref:4'-phosphopantetheinyl transferase family protein n=1 Tax=Pseudarthrobacter sp. NPDC058329 TaxID=3346448 RepID=UPI0036D80DB2